MSLERIALAEMLHEAECACGYLDQSYVDQADDLLPLLNARIDTAVAERLAEVLAPIEALAFGIEPDHYRKEACEHTAEQPYADNRYVRLLDGIRAVLPAKEEA